MTHIPGQRPARVMQGRAYKQLRDDLVRYCRGEVSGRSFVVSGHRGAGKTTLVLALVEELRAMAAGAVASPAADSRDPVHAIRRPFLVHVSAPDVYGRPVDPTASSTNLGDELLQHLSRKLHFAAGDEFVRAFRERALALSDSNPAKQELLAASGQLAMELRAGARLEPIRRFWLLADAMRSGILGGPALPGSEDSGVRELIALDASAEAYQIAIGKVASEEERGSKQDSAAAVDWTAALKSFVAPVAALVGGVAGAGVGVARNFSVGGALGASGVGVALALILTQSIAPQRSASRTDRYRFEPDTRVGSLAWRLPRTIDLLFAAGLAPVIVVDELDKRVRA